MSHQNFLPIIKLMMYGFGDSEKPLDESTILVDKLAREQLKAVVEAALHYAHRRKSPKIDVIDLIFVIRSNGHGIRRLLRLVKIKCEIVNKSNKSGELALLNEIEKAIKVIDTRGDLTDLSIPDPIKIHRELRANETSLKLNERQYAVYSGARNASFNKTTVRLFKSWIIRPEEQIKLSKHAIFVLRHFAFETVARIMDCALSVRTRSGGLSPLESDLIGVVQPGVNMGPLTPNEIMEGLLLCYSSEKSKSALFSSCSNYSSKKFILC